MNQRFSLEHVGFRWMVQDGAASSGGVVFHPCTPGVTCPDRIIGHDPMLIVVMGVTYVLTFVAGLGWGYYTGKKSAQSPPR